MKKLLLSSLIGATAIISCQTTPIVDTPEKSTGVDLRLPEGVSVRETPRGKVLNLYDPKAKDEIGKRSGAYEVKFQFNNTIEIGSYKEAYNLVSQVLKNNPNVRIIVEGNSSKEGPAKYNYDLSKRRSDTSYNYLIRLGSENSKLLKNAFGEALPEYPTLKENRRSEFVIILSEEDLKKYNDFAKTVDVNKETK